MAEVRADAAARQARKAGAVATSGGGVRVLRTKAICAIWWSSKPSTRARFASSLRRRCPKPAPNPERDHIDWRLRQLLPAPAPHALAIPLLAQRAASAAFLYGEWLATALRRPRFPGRSSGKIAAN
jgi:hypothetical protein